LKPEGLKPEGTPGSVVLQYPLGGIVQVVELAVSDRHHEKEGEDRAQENGDRKEKPDCVHVT
jgi:hypothetical protein